MKLIGIEWADLDKAKKVLAMLHKLQTISNEFEESSIKVYDVGGNEVKDCSYKEGYNEEWCEKVYFITMKKGIHIIIGYVLWIRMMGIVVMLDYISLKVKKYI